MGGSIYALRHLRTNFLATEGVPLPPNRSTEEEQQLAMAHWTIFERSARAHQPARIELTEDEINARLEKILLDALVRIWDTSQHHRISLRTATFAVACERILMAHKERGLYP